MPSINAAETIAEMMYLQKASLKIDSEKLKERISPVFDVFTQHLSDRRKQKTLEKVISSIHIIKEGYNRQGLGLNGRPSAYKRSLGVVEIAESKFDERGYLDWALVMKIGDVNTFNRIINHYNIAANAVASFYLDKSSQGLPKEGDEKKLWVAKHLIPIEFQREGTIQLAYRIGNQAKEVEKDREGAGLQHIYELTK